MLNIFKQLFNKNTQQKPQVNLSSFIKIKLLLTYINPNSLDLENVDLVSNLTLSNVNSLALLLEKDIIEYCFYHDFDMFLDLLQLFKLNLISIKQKLSLFIETVEESIFNQPKYTNSHSKELFDKLEYISNVDEFNHIPNLLGRLSSLQKQFTDSGLTTA